MTKRVSRPAPIRTDGSNVFASHTMRVRVPEILARTAETQARDARDVADAIRALRDEVASDAAIRPLAVPAPDTDEWRDPVAARAHESWLSTDWFFAETYLYRRTMEAVRFFETDVDPFLPIKEAELATAATWDRVAVARELAARHDETSIAALLDAALWGNRMDLSYAAAAAHGTTSNDADRLVDDRARALPFLLRRDARVAIVADNAGTELLVDLVLAGALLEAGAAQVTLHVKAHPTFVSDAVTRDVRHAVEKLGAPLTAFFASDRLSIAADFYWNGPRFIDEAPTRIVEALARVDIALVKGDANYRRLIGDATWDEATPPSRASGPLPCPMFALRTLKSDPIVGLARGDAERLDATDPTWRVNGRRGVMQMFDAARAP